MIHTKYINKIVLNNGNDIEKISLDNKIEWRVNYRADGSIGIYKHFKKAYACALLNIKV